MFKIQLDSFKLLKLLWYIHNFIKSFSNYLESMQLMGIIIPKKISLNLNYWIDSIILTSNHLSLFQKHLKISIVFRWFCEEMRSNQWAICNSGSFWANINLNEIKLSNWHMIKYNGASFEYISWNYRSWLGLLYGVNRAVTGSQKATIYWNRNRTLGPRRHTTKTSKNRWHFYSFSAILPLNI